jgi:two-component system nitrogen regulation sensor histidine kinase NtrY
MTGLRARLFLAFVLVAVPPLLLLALAVTAEMSRSFEQTATERLDTGLKSALARIEQMRKRAEGQVAAVATQDLPTTPASVEGDRTIAEVLGARRDLPALEILDAEGRVISSRHWPAGYGLKGRDVAYSGDGALRLARVAQDYGETERLALMPSREAGWRGATVTVRGGVFLDGDFLVDLSRLMDAEVALRDTKRGVWIAPPSSSLTGWAPLLEGDSSVGELALGGTSYRYRAAAIHPALWLVVAMPRTRLDSLMGQVRVFTLGTAAAALLAALLASLVLSGRIAEPIRGLASGARRVAAGDLDSSVEVTARDEIGDLGRAFNAMTAELRASRERLLQAERVAAWREMARRLAHELKNPLFPIQLSIETLRRALEKGGSQGSEFGALFSESSQTILEELRSLRGIIEEFSDFARMPRPSLAATDVNGVVDQVLALYQARGVVVEKNLEAQLPTLLADRDLLARALGNLVANALEAMPQGGSLRVRTGTRPGAVVVQVEDTGPGLTEDQRTRLFTPYYTTKRGGTGLGLAIVQGIISDHGGTIEVESETGAGTSFTLILPLNPAPNL